MTNTDYDVATFAGGCFWCMGAAFETYPGVHQVIAGFSGGQEEMPDYEQVSAGKTGHAESIQITYDPHEITYKELLEIFWRQIDPTDAEGSFSDRGKQYRTAIFYHTPEQKAAAERSKQKLQASGLFDKPIVTEIRPFKSFYPAEEYHQEFHVRNPEDYSYYRENSGRDQFRKQVWGSDKDYMSKGIQKLIAKVSQQKEENKCR
ncbi:peptide-methionine (S)-S-oxide reductase [Desulfuromusa kysingii]|uniref:Peptide methionine sulfoxide reductase MsrA n=1 Tax=Desulfuromusa kysingii TaxID=37625 RepID=A0A1H4A3K2_9BACT|nr:peptide-methionine (S)-S-oxide reductase MsrA [Desulfuromusa kysingii]SEA30477.1 peptide-methionine (S)-S-oxide reductase [Desulfuromusa kysingii]